MDVIVHVRLMLWIGDRSHAGFGSLLPRPSGEESGAINNAINILCSYQVHHQQGNSLDDPVYHRHEASFDDTG